MNTTSPDLAALFSNQGEGDYGTSNIHPISDDLPSSEDGHHHLMTITGLANHLGNSERHVRRLIAERRIPHLKVGKYIRFDPKEIAEWLDGLRVPETSRCRHSQTRNKRQASSANSPAKTVISRK